MLRANGIAPPPLQQHSGSKKRARSPDADVLNISDDDSEDESARIAKLEVSAPLEMEDSIDMPTG